MDATVLLAVLAAAAMHATWNAFIKGSDDPLSTLTQMASVAMVVAGCLLPVVGWPRDAAWPWLAGSAVLHTGYRLALVAAYKAGDLGQVYPIARGTAPLLTTLITALAIGETLPVLGNLGIVMLAAGVALLSLRGGRLSDLDRRATGYALQTSCWIAAYSFVDGYGARVAGSALVFVIWMYFINAVCGVVVGYALRGRAVAAGLAARWPQVLGATLISEAAYFIAIWAMTKAPIALVAALRETSVLFAAVISVVVLREPVTRWRIGAALVIVLGVILLRLR